MRTQQFGIRRHIKNRLNWKHPLRPTAPRTSVCQLKCLVGNCSLVNQVLAEGAHSCLKTQTVFFFFPETLYYFIFFSTVWNSAAPTLRGSMQTSCLLSFPWHSHPPSFTLNLSLTNLQTQPRVINCAKPGLQQWSRTVPLSFNTATWNNGGTKLPHYDTGKIWSAFSARCWEDLFPGPFAAWGWNEGWACFPGWRLPASQGQKSLVPLVLLDLSSNDHRDLLTCRWALLTVDGIAFQRLCVFFSDSSQRTVMLLCLLYAIILYYIFYLEVTS